MSNSGDRLDQLTEKLAQLIKSLADDKIMSYHDISSATGVSRNVLYYFASKTDRRSTIKADALGAIMRWFEERDFDSEHYNKNQAILAAEIREVLGISPEHSHEGNLLDTFHLEQDDVSRITSIFPNYLIGVRRRGTSKKFQISLHQFNGSTDGHSVKWKMIFLQGEKPLDEETSQISRADQDGVEVSGLATIEDKVITCLGRREETNTLNLLNIRIPQNSHTDPGIILASYNTYSKEEAISRKMVLISTKISATKSTTHFIGQPGDIEEEELCHRYPDLMPELKKAFLGYSLKSSGITLHPEDLLASHTETDG